MVILVWDIEAFDVKWFLFLTFVIFGMNKLYFAKQSTTIQNFIGNYIGALLSTRLSSVHGRLNKLVEIAKSSKVSC